MADPKEQTTPEVPEKDPCDNCTRPWCYGCPHQEDDDQKDTE